MHQKDNAFTLIELLIVVAIIAILAAIAVPNFLEAQVRSKVSRCHADERTIAVGLEAYCVDNNHYPWAYAAPPLIRLNVLSTPIAYITRVPSDPFADAKYDPVGWNFYRDGYPWCTIAAWGLHCRTYREAYQRGAVWWLGGRGPDRLHTSFWNWDWVTNDANIETTYDPTNGTLSIGDIERFGP